MKFKFVIIINLFVLLSTTFFAYSKNIAPKLKPQKFIDIAAYTDKSKASKFIQDLLKKKKQDQEAKKTKDENANENNTTENQEIKKEEQSQKNINKKNEQEKNKDTKVNQKKDLPKKETQTKVDNNKEIRPLNLLIDSDRMYPVVQSIFGKVVKYKKRGMQLVQFPASALGYNLKFYTDGSMEVLLPASYKGKSKAELQEFLETVAARIPVEGLTSIEKLKVAGFLPESLGNAIGLPNGIVVKSGTDYDFDKLNVYFPYFDSKGKALKYIENPSEEELEMLYKEFFNKEILLDKDYRELKREYQKKLDVELNELKKFKSEFLSKAGAKLNSLYQGKKELISDRKGLIVTKEEYKDAEQALKKVEEIEKRARYMER